MSETTLVKDRERAEATVQKAFDAFRRLAAQQASVANVALVRPGDFNVALNRLQEILTEPVGAAHQRLDTVPGDVLPSQIAAGLERAAATRRPGLPPATEAEVVELRGAAAALARAYATSEAAVPMLKVAFDGVVERVQAAVLERACALQGA